MKTLLTTLYDTWYIFIMVIKPYQVCDFITHEKFDLNKMYVSC